MPLLLLSICLPTVLGSLWVLFWALLALLIICFYRMVHLNVMCFEQILPSVLWRCWLGGRKGIRPVITEWWGAGVVICLQRGADLHMVQLMPLPLTGSCFSKIQIGFTFLVPAHPGSPGKRAVKRLCVCVFWANKFDLIWFKSAKWLRHSLRNETIPAKRSRRPIRLLSANTELRPVSLCQCLRVISIRATLC